ncbi:MAG: ATP--guanido phosphotransferase, partial [Firmicutes bacterium]|nr:ATP--guanido phosphotransferase [Bacillota bacterium]
MGVERFTGSARSKWMEGTGEDSDIVVSTRIRLARNLEELPFPAKAGPAEAAAVVSRLEKMVELSSPRGDIGDFWILRLKDLPPLDREVLVEKHLISPQL